MKTYGFQTFPPDGTLRQERREKSSFTLPMSLNYQRNSYKLWEAALKTYNDPDTKNVFNINWSAHAGVNKLKNNLLKYKLALQPRRHIDIWKSISKTIYNSWKTVSNLIKFANNDFVQLKYIVQNKYKKGFPYLSGAKIFNYWSFIIQQYGGTNLKNSKYIEIAPDTHITKCSVKLGVINEQEAKTLTKNEIAERWRTALAQSDIKPIEMHPPLWFWSRNGFIFKID